MKIKTTIFIVFLLAVTLIAEAQVLHVAGVVRDAESRTTLPYCNIVVSGASTGVTTDVNGKFSIHLDGPGKLVASFVGFGNDTITITKSVQNLLITLRPTAKSLDEVVVVSATMKEVSKMDSPIPVEIYSPAMFLKNPSPSIFESLNMVNGVQPQLNCNVCNTGDIHINGMEGPYTMLLIDGMPIVSSLSTVYGLSGIPNSMVKRIEVVKGPASTLYGSEAVGGLINIITKDASLSPRLKVDLSATSVQEYNADLSATFRFSGADALLGVNYFNYQNVLDINDDNFTDVTLQNRFSVFNKWDFKRKSKLPASIALRYVYEDRWGGELQWNRSHRGSAEIYGESIFTNRVEVLGNYGVALGGEKIAFDYSYNYHDQDSYYGTVSYQAQQHVAFGQLRWSKLLGRHDLLAGLPLRIVRYDDNTPATETELRNKADLTVLPGIFIQDEFKVTSELTLLGGLRYDHHNKHGAIFSPRFSAKITPAKDHAIRVSTGNGFRVVNLFTEDHAALTGSREVVIREELQPEQSWNVNLNYAALLANRGGFANLDISFFYTYFTNKIVADFLSDPEKIIYDNLKGHAVSKGITFNADITLLTQLKFIGGLTVMDVYQKEKDAFGNERRMQQLFAPSLSGTYTLSYTFAKPSITLDLTGRTNGPMKLPVLDRAHDQRPDTSPTYTLLNFQVSKIFDNGLEIYTGVKNILNFRPKDPILNWQDPSSPYFDTTYNYAPMQGIKGYAGVRFTIQ